VAAWEQEGVTVSSSSSNAGSKVGSKKKNRKEKKKWDKREEPLCHLPVVKQVVK